MVSIVCFLIAKQKEKNYEFLLLEAWKATAPGQENKTAGRDRDAIFNTRISLSTQRRPCLPHLVRSIKNTFYVFLLFPLLITFASVVIFMFQVSLQLLELIT